ncbi:MAG: hypothetical protein HY908_32300 [Myxococcales bacterium]|nr:hypothetical protein [Myxococcales bacterium]
MPVKGTLPGRAARRWPGALALAALVAGPGCSGEEPPVPTLDIGLETLAPGSLVPGTTLVLGGSSFVPDFAGPSSLHLAGELDGSGAEIVLPVRFVDYDRAEVDWPGGLAAGLPADEGTFLGEGWVEAESALDGLWHASARQPVALGVHAVLAPRLDAVQNDALFVNDPVLAVGDGFLFGGAEGETVAIVTGCFTPDGAPSCTPVGPTEVPARPFQPFDRARAVFPFSPYIAGIEPGHFEGTVSLVNRHGPLAGGAELASAAAATANDLVTPAIFGFAPPAASLGQYVDVTGGGFVGVPDGGAQGPAFELTTIELEGTFTPDGGTAVPASLSLVPEFVSGQLVRYVLNEEDALGQAIDLRSTTGEFVGTARPVTELGNATVSGSATPVVLGVAPVKQVVWLRFLPSYVESLRHFGLRAADARIRERVLDVVARDYGGVNVEARSEEPEDFALYAEVELGGPDPNGVGLLGYDNTPGKDNGNARLYDKIGGHNALTQLDGYPGYGGVFVESLFGYSLHPGALATQIEGADATFDALFDTFRPDLGGTPASAEEIAAAPLLVSADGCPAADRVTQVSCAVWALGGLIGTTLSHEVAHSLGLSDPGGPAFHTSGDFAASLMDAGWARPFVERAEVAGHAEGRFCQNEFDYLQQILPTGAPDPVANRPACQ